MFDVNTMKGSRVIGENRGDGIHGKDDVGHLHGHQREQQRRGRHPPRAPHDELRALVVGCHGHEPREKANGGIPFRMLLRLSSEEQPPAGQDQDAAEDVDRPVQRLQQGSRPQR